MLLPLLAWATTGVIFLTKPGYDGAYERLSIKTYPLAATPAIEAPPAWQEVRWIRSVLGPHLLVKSSNAFWQGDPSTGLPLPPPSAQQVRQLITDAIRANPQRYGQVHTIEGLSAVTTTDIHITLNWNNMSLQQKGKDREFIDTLYKIHYLQWTKWDKANTIFGVVGLIGLFSLTLLGFFLFLSAPRKPE